MAAEGSDGRHPNTRQPSGHALPAEGPQELRINTTPRAPDVNGVPLSPPFQ